jgi:hypothetical protein
VCSIGGADDPLADRSRTLEGMRDAFLTFGKPHREDEIVDSGGFPGCRRFLAADGERAVRTWDLRARQLDVAEALNGR